jgi:hypothetical protein
MRNVSSGPKSPQIGCAARSTKSCLGPKTEARRGPDNRLVSTYRGEHENNDVEGIASTKPVLNGETSQDELQSFNALTALKGEMSRRSRASPGT